METYRAYETPQGPQLELLGQAETKLPAPLKKRGTAWTIAAALALLSVLLLGGLKLKGQYGAVQRAYTQGSAGDGYSLSFDLQNRQDAAANIITVGAQVLGQEDTAVQSARQALEALQAAREKDGPAAQYQANSALGKTVDLLYQTMQSTGLAQDKAMALQTQWSEFLSRQDLINGSDYNEMAQSYNDTVSGFPANVVAALWGCGKVELFA